MFSIATVVILVAVAAAVGLLVGRKNPSLASAAAALVAAGEAKAQAFIADAKAKLGAK